MNKIVVNSLNDFFKEIEKFQKNSWLKFRGQSNSEWICITTANRLIKFRI